MFLLFTIVPSGKCDSENNGTTYFGYIPDRHLSGSHTLVLEKSEILRSRQTGREGWRIVRVFRPKAETKYTKQMVRLNAEKRNFRWKDQTLLTFLISSSKGLNKLAIQRDTLYFLEKFSMHSITIPKCCRLYLPIQTNHKKIKKSAKSDVFVKIGDFRISIVVLFRLTAACHLSLPRPLRPSQRLSPRLWSSGSSAWDGICVWWHHRHAPMKGRRRRWGGGVRGKCHQKYAPTRAVELLGITSWTPLYKLSFDIQIKIDPSNQQKQRRIPARAEHHQLLFPSAVRPKAKCLLLGPSPLHKNYNCPTTDKKVNANNRLTLERVNSFILPPRWAYKTSIGIREIHRIGEDFNHRIPNWKLTFNNGV